MLRDIPDVPGSEDEAIVVVMFPFSDSVLLLLDFFCCDFELKLL